MRPSTVAADNLAFSGANGEQLAAITAALTAGRSDLQGLLGVATGVEIRSKADGHLTLGSDWNLVNASAPRPAEATVLTLRAANNLYLPYSLSDGFATLANNSALVAGTGASFRLVAGSDFYAADPLATNAAATQGDLVIGRAASSANTAPPTVLLRTTTGNIDLVAARDLVTYSTAERTSGTDRRSQVRIYTTGQAVTAAELPGFSSLGITGLDQLLRVGSTVQGPFFDNAGDVRLQAGRDILGSPAVVYASNGSASSTQYVTDWWYRQTNDGSLASEAAGVALWSRYDRFAQGVASFGGGDVAATAGRDILDLDLSTPATGYRVAADASPGGTVHERWFSGGDLSVQAGGDVQGGLFNAGGAQASLQVGGSIVAGSNPLQPAGYSVPQWFYGDTAWQVTARQGIGLGSPTQPGLLAGVAQGNAGAPRTTLVTGLANHASAQVLSLAGSVLFSNERPTTSGSGGNPGAGAVQVPDQLTVLAPQGAVQTGVLLQQPVGDSGLQLLARDGVAAEALRLFAPQAADQARPVALEQPTLAEKLDTRTREWNHTAGEAPLPGATRLVSLQGDVSLGAVVSFAAQAVRLIAGRDVRLDAELLVQHPLETDAQGQDLARQTTLLQAGRDLQFGSLAGLRVAGSGDVLAVAARDIDLGRGMGIVSIGNQENSQQLPSGGASITLMAGTTWADYQQAVARQVHLLGSGFENSPGLLLVQLEALKAGGRLLDAAAAQAAAQVFDAQDTTTQTARVAAVMGQPALDSARQAWLDRNVAKALALSEAAAAAAQAGAIGGTTRSDGQVAVPGSEFLAGSTLLPVNADGASRNAAQAAVVQRLRQALQPQALAGALAQYTGTLDAATQRQLALAVGPYGSALQQFVAQRSAGNVTSTADAAARFAVMAPEQQALFLNQVLTAELKAAGRAALQGERVRYLRGYDAMDALFPGVRPAGRISLANSQVKSAQGGDLRLLAPGGGVNVGDLANDGINKAASEVGIVTAAGGDISAVVGGSVEVNQSRVFTVAQGDVLLWARLGNLDAGRGAKTVTGSPPPVVTINAQGQVVVDTSGSFSGSGIAVLNAGSALDLYAPLGEINAGEAGIQSAGNAFLGATQLVGADNLGVGGAAVGVPVKAPEAPTASLAGLAQAASAAASPASTTKDEEEDRRKRPRRQLFLDFLGFSRGE
ncbi:MAG: filamentous hemagglutinin family protein [Rubrivivax sp.]